jgi:hypothetical protein
MEKLSWDTVEYLHKEKTPDWYWIVGIVTISIAIISIILNNLIFAILIIISSFTLSLFASKKPEIIEVDIDMSGVTVGRNHYLYKDLESFWIETRDSYPRVLLKSKKVFMPFIMILIEGVEPNQIQELLSKYLPEEEHVEPLLEKILLYFGF